MTPPTYEIGQKERARTLHWLLGGKLNDLDSEPSWTRYMIFNGKFMSQSYSDGCHRISFRNGPEFNHKESKHLLTKIINEVKEISDQRLREEGEI